MQKFQKMIVVCLSLAVSACVSVGPEYSSPDNDSVEKSIYSERYQNYDIGAVDRLWEQRFVDDTLLRLIELTRESNKDVQVAIANIEAARARLNLAETQMLPQGGADATYQRQRQLQADRAEETQTNNLYSAGVATNWLISLFGRTQREIERAMANLGGLEAIAVDVERLQVGLTISTYLSLQEINARSKILQDNIATLTRILNLTQERLRVGQRAEFDVLRQETLLSQTQSNLQQLGAQRDEILAALALTTGQSIPELESLLNASRPYEDSYFQRLFNQPVSIDSAQQVLRRRPDVRIAERQLAAATATVGLITAELFPKLTLSASAAVSSNTSDGLLSATPTYAAGPSLSWSVFSYPAILAEIEASEAQVKAAKAEYEKVVLQTLNETDAALSAYAKSINQVEYLAKAKASSQRSLFLAEERYKAGADSLLTLLDVQRTAFQVESDFVAAQYAAARRRLDVHIALGG